jgi:hypothetical protein
VNMRLQTPYQLQGGPKPPRLTPTRIDALQ